MRWITTSLISIPYGSIKSGDFFAFEVEKWKFQFLMVRLKECFYADAQRNKDISIPYGSIKSVGCYYQLALFDHFNSLWFD